jgi:small-conductance mechanosensitive channel
MQKAAESNPTKRNTNVGIAATLIVSIALIIILYYALSYFHINANYMRLMLSIVSLLLGIGIITLLSSILNKYIETKGVRQEAGTISRLFSIIAYIVLIIIILSLLNVNVTGLLISAGFLGIVLGLAAQPTLGNIFSGVSMIIAKPFEPGDYITVQTWQYNKMPSTYPHDEFIPGYSGTISKIGLLYTEIFGESDAPLYVPNGILNQAMVINHKRSDTFNLSFMVEIQKTVPYHMLEKHIKAMLKRHNAHNECNVAIRHISENSYSVSISIKTKRIDKINTNLKAKLLKDILEYSTKINNSGKK